MNLTLTPLKIKISLRREIRLALLAAMEACWVYAVFALVASLIVVTPPTVFSIFLAYWIALIIGRIAPRVRMPWVQVQIVVLAFALATAFYLGWIELYARQFLFDPNWIAQFTRALTELGNGLSRAHLIAAAVVYTFVRGLGFAERPLTLWFIGFQFRLGIVFFFFVLIASAFLKPLDLSAWILVYFILSLFAIALARIDEMGSDLPVGPRWAIFLLAAVGLVIFLGLAGVRVFTLEALQGSLSMLTPLWNVIQFLFLLFIIPASFVVEF
ncbi:MAG: hypothetical protein HY070_00145, partial [Chloroflexi bacterium]|nr:hypothetical protein [Chloroflexota bacterium]